MRRERIASTQPHRQLTGTAVVPGVVIFRPRSREADDGPGERQPLIDRSRRRGRGGRDLAGSTWRRSGTAQTGTQGQTTRAVVAVAPEKNTDELGRSTIRSVKP